MAFLFGSCAPKGIQQGAKAPDFKAELIDGSDFSLSDLKGNYILLDFWGSWCGPCLREMPQLVALHAEYTDKKYRDATGFKVVSVALEKNDKSWKKTADRMGIKWEHQIVNKARFVMMNDIAKKYGVTDLPSKFLLNPDGELIAINRSFIEIKTLLNNRLAD